MGDVAFRLAFKTSDMNSLNLPIEIRKTNSALVNRVLSAETTTLPAGDYYAVACMPGGQRLLAPFSVTEPPAETPLTVTLAPEPEDESPHEWEEVRHFLGRQNARVEPGPDLAPLAPQSLEVTRSPRRKSISPGDDTAAVVTARRTPFLRVFMGNVVQGTHGAVRPDDLLSVTQADPDRVMQCDVKGRNMPLIAQLVQPDGRVQNLALPISGITHIQLVVSREPGGDVRLEAYLENNVANMMLQYTGAGWSSTASKATDATSMRAEKLLMEKMGDPIAAAIGAYAILRLGSIEQLHDWTTNLRHRFPWLPDGSAIAGEHLARLGRFEEAFDAFADVPSRGLPIFADGLFYTIERMKLYAGARLKSRGRVDPSLAQHVVDQLQPFATFVRRQRPICSYPGLDVAAPDAEPAPADVVNDGMDLGPWFPAGLTPGR